MQNRRHNRPVVSPVVVTTPPPPTHHTAVPDCRNEAGGLAFRKSEKLALLTLIFSTLMAKGSSKFYESDKEVTDRLSELVKAVPEFAAKCAVFARRVLGMRSISHCVAAMVCRHTRGMTDPATQQGPKWVRQFVNAVIFRPDDALEIAAAYTHLYPEFRRAGKLLASMPGPMKRGMADALSTFGEYQLAKYANTGGKPKLVDLINMVHPRPSAETQEAVRALMTGKLKNTETWEAQLSAAGSDLGKKATIWFNLLTERKLGYFAALRNIRNILAQSPQSVDMLLALIRNENAIAKCLILPHQFLRTHKALCEASSLPRVREAISAVEFAMEFSCRSIPCLPGRTIVCLDGSGSMFNTVVKGQNEESNLKAIDVASLFAATVLKSQPNAEFMEFASTAKVVSLQRGLSLPALGIAVRATASRGGTNFHRIFETLSGAYDNIIILSDGEGWDFGKDWNSQMGAPTTARRKYELKHGVNPFIALFDTSGAGSMMFPEDSVVTLAGVSDKVFTLLAELKKDRNALISLVEQTSFATVDDGDES